MKEMMEAYQTCKRILMKKVRQRTATAFLLTFFWGMIAHAYGLLHSSFIHDSLNAVYIEDSERLWKMAIGRIFVNLYRDIIRGNWAVPWLIGIISLVFIAISVRLIVEMFDIETLLGFSFLSGIMVVNKTVTSLAATYIFEMDVDMLALLLSVAAAYCWSKRGKGWLFGILCICISLGLYQAYLSVTVTLMLLFLFYQILSGNQMDSCVKLAGKGCVQLLAGGGTLSHLPDGRKNNLEN